ncbi:hypothetical protein D3G70_13540 [Escherichia coli]|nr:hypothetical protein [Escherichia coli]
MVVVNEHDNHDRQRLDSSLVYTGAHNVVCVMLKRPLLDFHPAAAFLYITPLCVPKFLFFRFE